MSADVESKPVATPVGFGARAKRFEVCGIHPGKKYPGTFVQVCYDKKSMAEENRRLGPGSYNIAQGGFAHDAIKQRSSGPGWKHAYDAEIQAKMPHLLNREQFEKQKKLKENLGPGTYNSKDMWQELDSRPKSIYGICSTREERFAPTSRDPPKNFVIPGPGTYGDGGIPGKRLEVKEKERTSTVIMRASDGKPRMLPQVGCDLGPGQYEYKSFTTNLIEKVTSKKGPYDLFNVSRSKPINTGYYAQPSRMNLGPGQYPTNSFTDKWNDPYWGKKGKFGKLEQFPWVPTERIYCNTLSQCPRRSTDPGPGCYNITEPAGGIKHITKPKVGFNMSSERIDRRARTFFMGAAGSNPCGVGRYDIEKSYKTNQQGCTGHVSSFKSKTQRYGASGMAARDLMLQERMREKDVQLETKQFMVHSATH